MSYMAMAWHNDPCWVLRGHEIFNLGRPFLSHHYSLLIISELCPQVEKKIFKENTSFDSFYPQIFFPWVGGHKSFNSLVSLPYRCCIQNFVKIDPVVLEKMFTDDRQWRMPTHSIRSPKWLRWPKNRLQVFVYS